MQCVMDHIVLNVRDIDRMLAFYTDLMQLQTERLEEFRAGETFFPSLRLNENTIIDLFEKRGGRSNGSPNLNHFCIALDKRDWDALLTRLDAAGVKLDGDPGERWGARGNAIAVSFPDPEGNVIEARYYP